MEKKSQGLFVRDPYWTGQLPPTDERVVVEGQQAPETVLTIESAPEMEKRGVDGQ